MDGKGPKQGKLRRAGGGVMSSAPEPEKTADDASHEPAASLGAKPRRKPKPKPGPSERPKGSEWRRLKRESDPVWAEKLRERDRIAARKKRYRDVYGITLEDYDRMLEEQGGLCKVCRKPSEKPLVVDHCHVRLKVRGLMCGGCNQMMGFSGDDPDVMDAGARLLREFYRKNPL